MKVFSMAKLNPKLLEDRYVYPPEKTVGHTFDKISTSTTCNIKMKQYLCVRHSLPKTRLKNTILYDNVNENRHLRNKLLTLRSRREKTSLYFDINKRNFERGQAKKRYKWKREDLETVSSWKLPTIDIPPGESNQNILHAKTMYTVPSYGSESEHSQKKQPVLPMLNITRERTEIVTKGNLTYLAQLPPVVHVDQTKLLHYNSYIGKAINQMWSNDQRFLGLHSNLQPAILRQGDQYPIKNMMSKSRLSQFTESLLNLSKLRTAKKVCKVIVVSKPSSQVSCKQGAKLV